MRQKRAAKPHVSSPAFQVYPNDITGDPNFQMMNPTQRGCYFSLWLYSWRSFAIPKDFSLLSLLCGITADEMEKAWPRIAVFFTEDPNDPEKLIHPGLEKERAKQAAFKAAKRLAGSKGGKALKAKRASGNESGTTTISPLAKGVAKSASSSSSSSSSSDSLSPKPPQGEKRESDAIEEPEARILLRAEIGSIFQRPAKRAWSETESEALAALGEVTPQEIATLKRFYAANIEAKKDRRRHNLESLLRNWSGELDKAQGFFTALQRKISAL
jgi:uncharacterized protein YdaU (DUF1376 family)